MVLMPGRPTGAEGVALGRGEPMPGSTIRLPAKCPKCAAPLMSAQVRVDGLPSVDMLARVGGLQGHIYLSQVYGSYDKRFAGVADISGSVAESSCPHCREPFPYQLPCACGAPMIGVDLVCGGIIKICTRNGCRRHFLQFVDVDDAFTLFESQEE